MKKQKGIHTCEAMILVAIFAILLILVFSFLEWRHGLRETNRLKPYRVYHIYGNFSPEVQGILDKTEIRKYEIFKVGADSVVSLNGEYQFNVHFDEKNTFIKLNNIQMITSETITPSPLPGQIAEKKVKIDKLTIEYKREEK